MRKIITVIIFSLSVFAAAAQRITVEEYVAQYKDIAISEMKRMGVPASITLAQGILETESGNSDLVRRSNNHFGIKCKSTWTGESVTHDDDANGECFRAYKTPEESYRDHSNFLRSNKRYSALFSLDIADYKGWAYGLKKAGYATNPRYPEILIRNIEQYNLQQYSLTDSGKAASFDPSKYEDDKEVPVIEPATTNESSNSTLDMAGKVVKINGSNCVLATKGTSLLVIATKNNINLNKLLEYNELAEDGILGKDQYVYLEKKRKTGEAETHTVKAGETVYDVSQKNGIQLQYLLDYNKLADGAAMAPGTVLVLKPGAKINAEQKDKGTFKRHKVAPKESLYSISKIYNVTVDELKQWNRLDSDGLRIGQELIVGN